MSGMGYRSHPGPRAGIRPCITPAGVHAGYMTRVVLAPRMPDPKRKPPFGRVVGWDETADRVWVQWLSDERRPRLTSAVRAQFLRVACPICRLAFEAADDVHTHRVDDRSRTFTPAGVVPDPDAPRPRLSNGGPLSILGPGGPAALLGITTPHNGPDALTIRNPSINAETAGWGTDPGDDALRAIARSRGLLP